MGAGEERRQFGVSWVRYLPTLLLFPTSCVPLFCFRFRVLCSIPTTPLLDVFPSPTPNSRSRRVHANHPRWTVTNKAARLFPRSFRRTRGNRAVVRDVFCCARSVLLCVDTGDGRTGRDRRPSTMEAIESLAGMVSSMLDFPLVEFLGRLVPTGGSKAGQQVSPRVPF